jgi:nucleotide-binding universal stress UspA family protein
MDLPPIVLDDAARDQLRADLRRLVAADCGVAIDVIVREAPDPPAEILHQADALGADLLVVGSHGRTGFERLLLGSVTEKVLRKATCPVMVVPRAATGADAAPGRFRRILCPVDFSDASVTALPLALSIAQESDATLTLMHVIEVPPELAEPMPPFDYDPYAVHAAAVAASLTRLREFVPASARTYCTLETLVREGSAYRQVLAVAAEGQSDLIVMGVHGRGALDLLLFGSNTARVTRGATCPVLVVRRP